MAAARSFTSTPDGVNLINRALADRQWSRDDFWQQCDCTRQPVINFCSGKKPVSKKLFVSFCEILELEWDIVSGLKQTSGASELVTEVEDIGALVKRIRRQVKGDIHNRCGTMRVLDMEQPIGIGDIYTSVNILEKVSGRRRLKVTELLDGCDEKDFDRFMLGQVKRKRVPGLEAVEQYNRLMILGKPGAGKTTFMKRLAVLCNQGKFQAGRVPVFVTLKEFAEATGQLDLQTYITEQWQRCDVQNIGDVAEIFKSGNALVLLDGLDEVQETEHDRVQHCIEEFTGQFWECQFVMTCRIAAREYVFQQFTEVEIADFNEEQIAEFATRWFDTKKDAEKGKNFIQRLKDNEPIQELATNPLLLTLLCLVFGEAADFPHNRAELYKEGLDVLLKKWDAKCNIERDQVYKKLSLKRKEDLLAQLAFNTFEKGDYFFKQRIVEQHITDYIINLPGAKEDEAALQLDSEAVLNSIEAQHGLLVERARGIYSFSHLTFHEYFTAKQIVSPSVQIQQALKDLATHVTEKRYREIFLLAVSMLPQADELLWCMKQQIDQLLAGDDALQQQLHTVHQKVLSVNVKYKASATRVFYFSFALTSSVDLSLARNLDSDLDRDLQRYFYIYLYRNHILAGGLAHHLDLDLYIDHNLDLDLDRNFYQNADSYRELYRDITRASARAGAICSQLQTKLETLRQQLPDTEDTTIFRRWWQEHGETWGAELRSVMIEHRNIGHDWQFTDVQKEKLQLYYDANKLLVDCLNSDCYVTKETRQEIEDTLLLPTSELKKERPHNTTAPTLTKPARP